MPWDHSPPGTMSTKTKDSDEKYMKIEKYYAAGQLSILDFVFQKYGKFWSHPLSHFIKHKPPS